LKGEGAKFFSAAPTPANNFSTLTKDYSIDIHGTKH
jgi:hypothetical protein